VTLPSGVTFHNPMRVVANNDGSELIFTHYRQPDVSGQHFAEDGQVVQSDLNRLKEILES